MRGRRLLGAGRPREALDCAEEALRLEPRDPDGLYLLGEAHYRCGQLAPAEDRLRQAIQANPRIALYYSTLGNVLQDRGALNEAIRAYRRAIRLNPDFAEPHNDLGTAYFAQGDAARAAAAYLKAARLRPDHAVAYANLGSVYRKLGLPSEARRALQREFWLRLRRRLRFFSQLPRRTLIALANSELKQGNPALGARLAQRAIQADPNNAAAHAVSAAAHEQLGDLAKAVASLEAAVKLRPGDASLRAQLGSVLSARGDIDNAIIELEHSVRLRQDSVKTLATLAELHLSMRNLDRAEELARHVIKRDASGAAGHFLLGETLYKLGRTVDAEGALRSAVSLDAEHVRARVRLGELLLHGGRVDEAETCLREALDVDDESASALFALALVLRERGKMKEAIECLEHVQRLDPGRVQALQLIGDMLRYADRTSEAESRLREGLKTHADEPRLLVGLAMVLGDQLRYDEAFVAVERALKREPGSGIALGAKALLLDITGRKAEAQGMFRAALRIEPKNTDIGFSHALFHLRHGNLADGWKGFELRRFGDNFVGRYRKLPFPEWRGEPLEGKTVLVYPEQGLGDEIMYSSCVPELAARARHVALECDPKLGAIFARSFSGCTVTPRPRTMANDWVNHLEPRPDFQVPIGSLPLRFRLHDEAFRAHNGYLIADPAKVAAWRARLNTLGPGPKIGIAWRGGVAHTGKGRRSLSLEQLRPVLRTPGAHFVSLQYTDVHAELADFRARSGIAVHHWNEAIDDYDETAALVCALDRVLTVCTAIVHLTGALGRPAIVMVPYGSDWRYGVEGNRMRWYPSVQLVRQKTIGEWASVLETVQGLITHGA